MNLYTHTSLRCVSSKIGLVVLDKFRKRTQILFLQSKSIKYNFDLFFKELNYNYLSIIVIAYS